MPNHWEAGAVFVRISVAVVVFLGLLCTSVALAETRESDNRTIRDSYRKLLTLFPEDRQGYGLDRFKLATEDQPMSYGLVLSAEAIRARNERVAKDSPSYRESRRRVRKAAAWLVQNADLDRDGKLGWGLPQSWDAWGDGTENPCHQPYTITSAIVLNGLLDALEVPKLFDESQREEILQVMRSVVMRWCREVWSDGYGGGYFWYSPSKNDDIFGINAPAMFLGSLVRLLDEQGDSLSAEERKLVVKRVESLAKAIVSTVTLRDGEPFWRYAPLPNRVGNTNPNDLVHHVYILMGIEQYRDWDGSRVKIPWTREKAITSVDRFLDGADKDKNADGRILELAALDKPKGFQARLWGAGFMLAFYAKWADDTRINRVFRLIEKNYGPMPRQHWIGPDSQCKDKDACYPRHNAHVLYGMAIAAFQKGDDSVNQKDETNGHVQAFLADYQKQYAQVAKKAHLAEWKAANTGKKEDFDAAAETELAVKKLHSDPKAYAQIVDFKKSAAELSPVDARALDVAELAFKANQLPSEMMDRMVRLSSEISHTFNTYRATIDGKTYSNNDLLEMLGKETDSGKRKQIWAALKQVGEQVAPKLIELAQVRNKAAEQLGYENFWDMKIRLQEHDPVELMAIFDELEKMTDGPFKEMKGKLDAELAVRFKIEPEQMRPWHYDNPFFQSAPHSSKVDLDEFYKDKPKEEIVRIAETFFGDIGLPIEEIVSRSDLYEREGKDQHAFCTSIDRGDDVRTLLNIKPTAEWMDTMLHEQGHAIYDVGIERELPFNLREPAHIFTTEGVAMLCGALAKNPAWLIEYAGADQARIEEFKDAILEQRRREQLIFARWTMVMLNFEKAMYENPSQDLNKLWWDCVERYQMIERPEGRDAADWAAKPHFTIAPVYYHNYMLGELFAAQMRKTLAKMAGHEGPTSTLNFNGRKQFGKFLQDKVFRPGAMKPWPEFVEEVTGEKLSPKDFAEEVK